jgi:hypothetical protein
MNDGAKGQRCRPSTGKLLAVSADHAKRLLPAGLLNGVHGVNQLALHWRFKTTATLLAAN